MKQVMKETEQTLVEMELTVLVKTTERLEKELEKLIEVAKKN